MLVLEPDAHPAATPFKQALVDDGIPRGARVKSTAIEPVPSGDLTPFRRRA